MNKNHKIYKNVKAYFTDNLITITLNVKSYHVYNYIYIWDIAQKM